MATPHRQAGGGATRPGAGLGAWPKRAEGQHPGGDEAALDHQLTLAGLGAMALLRKLVDEDPAAAASWALVHLAQVSQAAGFQGLSFDTTRR